MASTCQILACYEMVVVADGWFAFKIELVIPCYDTESIKFCLSNRRMILRFRSIAFMQNRLANIKFVITRTVAF